MKIRHGFVSNSSSSSFVVCVDVDTAKKALGVVNPTIRKQMREWFLDPAEVVMLKTKKWYSFGGIFESEETYGILDDNTDGDNEDLAFEEIHKFFASLGPLSHFNHY